MLLTADIGNTNIKFGVFNGRELIHTLTINCNKAKTADEYGLEIYSLIRVMGIHRDDFTGCIISSVVPIVTTCIDTAVRNILGIEPIILGPGVKTGLNIRIDDPSTLGADLVAACVAANSTFNTPADCCDECRQTSQSCAAGEVQIRHGRRTNQCCCSEADNDTNNHALCRLLFEGEVADDCADCSVQCRDRYDDGTSHLQTNYISC